MRVSVFTKVVGMVVMDSVTLLVKADVTVEGVLETVREKLSGLSAVQVREKDALGSMLYLLVALSSTLSEKWREAVGGAVRSVVNSRKPAVEDEMYSEGVSIYLQGSYTTTTINHKHHHTVQSAMRAHMCLCTPLNGHIGRQKTPQV